MTSTGAGGGRLHEMCKRWCARITLPSRLVASTAASAARRPPVLRRPARARPGRGSHREDAAAGPRPEGDGRGGVTPQSRNTDPGPTRPIGNRRRVEPPRRGTDDVAPAEAGPARRVQPAVRPRGSVRAGRGSGWRASWCAPPACGGTTTPCSGDGPPEAALVEVLRNPRDW